jgi:hypothetical protein
MTGSGTISAMALALLVFPLSVPASQQPSASKLIPPASELKPLPPEQDDKFRAEMIGNAHLRQNTGMRIVKTMNRGIDAAIVSTLEEQRAYLQTHPFAAVANTMSSRNSPVGLQGNAGSRPSAFPASGPSGSRAGSASTLAVPSSSRSNCQSAGIRAVNGKVKGAVFTPQAPDNHYKIEGCFFGNQRGQAQLKLDSNAPSVSPQLLSLRLESPNSWNETEIDVQVDPFVSRLRDYSGSATLQIFTASGQLLELPGCSFSAVRGEPVLLTFIPSSWVKLNATHSAAGAIHTLEYVSPTGKGGGVPADARGTSALVMRADREKFQSAKDVFDFSHLLNGWVVFDAQLQPYASACPEVVMSSDTQGSWESQFDAHSVTVSWEADNCASYIAPFFNFNTSFSQYAMSVWVIGPRGTEFMPSNGN